MANFYLIDPSFRDFSGHHGDYVRCIATAAQEMGFGVVIGAHRSLSLEEARQDNELGSFEIRPVFHHTTYQADSLLAGLRKMKRKPTRRSTKKMNLIARWCDQWAGSRQRARRQSLVRQFARDCATLFGKTSFTENDHVFFAMISDLELVGLTRYLTKHPESVQPQWHAQFHINLLDGRPPDYEQQSETIEAVGMELGKALSQAAYHHLSLYTTTVELADQYNHLGISHFSPLPYPVANEFAPAWHLRPPRQHEAMSVLALDSLKLKMHESRSFAEPAANQHHDHWSSEPPALQNLAMHSDESDSRPLRVVCAGGVRREKGQSEYLQPLVDQIFESHLASEKVQLVVQRPAKKLLAREKIEVALPPLESGIHVQPIDYVPHPLPRASYCDLIHSADIGLMFYDSETYFSRRAGILGEFLSLGKPVIVPAGSWLAEQIAEPVFRHADSCFNDVTPAIFGLSDFRWDSANVPIYGGKYGGKFSFDRAKHPFRFECDIPTGQSKLGIRFDWHCPRERGVYCRIEVEQLDASGGVIGKSCQVVGHRIPASRLAPKKKPIALFSLVPQTCRLRITFRNAFHASSVIVQDVELRVASDGSAEHSSATGASSFNTFPVSAVGVIVPDLAHLPECLIEVVNHFEHYRQSAEAFSTEWFARHQPQRTIAQLLSSDQLASGVA